MDLTLLKELNLPIGQYAVFGSGPITIRGIRESNDIDLIVRSSFWEKLQKIYYFRDERKNCIQIENIVIYNKWIPEISKTIEELIDEAEFFDGIPFVPLKYVMEYKIKRGNPKEKVDVELINQYLQGQETN